MRPWVLASSCLLALLAPAASTQEPHSLTLVHACSLENHLAAKLGRARLLEDSAAGKDSLIVATGGALSTGPALGAALAEAAGFDVANLAHRDLRGDPKALAAAMGSSRVKFVSASFKLPAAHKTPWQDFVVVERNGRRIAVVGIAMRSQALGLPGSGVIEGLQFIEVKEALAAVLPKAAAASEMVIVLADGNLSELGIPILARDEVDAAIISARGAGVTQRGWKNRLWQAPAGGKAFGVLRLGTKGSKARGSVLSLREPEAASPAYEQVAQRFGCAPLPLEEEEDAVAAEPPRTLEKLEFGKLAALTIRTRNRAARLEVRSLGLFESYAGYRAAKGHRLLVIDSHWQNIITPQVLRDQQMPVAYKIPTLSDHLYCVANGRRNLRFLGVSSRSRSFAGKGLSLARMGSEAKGRLVYELPAKAALNRLTLFFFDYAHGPMTLPLLVSPDAEAPSKLGAVVPTAKNRVLEAGVYDLRKVKEYAGVAAPQGKSYVVVELLARSLFTFPGDATAFDPAAKRGDTIPIGTVADWKDVRTHLHILVDGEYSYAVRLETVMPKVPRFLPDVLTGAEVVFLVPDGRTSMELLCEFPNASPPGGKVFHPKALRFALEGKPPPFSPQPKAIVAVEEEAFAVSIVSQSIVEQFAGEEAGSGRKFLVVDVTCENRGKKGEFFQPKAQLKYVSESGRKIDLDKISYQGMHPPAEPHRIPAGERRSFQVVYRIGEKEKSPRLAYAGWTLAKTLSLDPSKTTAPVTGVGAEVAKKIEKVDEKPREAPQLPEPPEKDMGKVTQVAPDMIDSWLEKRLSNSVDLAYYGYGSTLEINPPPKDPRLLRRLIDRERYHYSNGTSQVYTLTLLAGREAWVDGVGIHYRYPPWKGRVLVQVEDTDGYRVVASDTSEGVERNGLAVYEFTPTRTKRVRIRVESQRDCGVAEFVVFEEALENRANSALSAGGFDIASLPLGGVVFYLSKGWGNAAALLDQDATSYGRIGVSVGPPASFVLAFSANKTARVASVGLRHAVHSGKSHAEELPARIRLFASREDAFGSYQKVGEFPVKQTEGQQIFTLDGPIEARFLKVEVVPRPKQKRIALSEFAAYEGTANGYVSICLRGGGVDLTQQTKPERIESLIRAPKLLGEVEPNNKAANAQAVQINSWVKARLATPDDRDLFRFTLKPAETNLPVITLHMLPFLQAKARILDASSKPLLDLRSLSKGGTSARLEAALPGGEYLLELLPSPQYVLLAYDTSGSMRKAFGPLEEAIRKWARDLPPGFRIGLAISTPESGKKKNRPITIKCPFTDDSQKLEAALKGMFDGNGRSDWYNLVSDFLAYMDEKVPEDAAGTLVFIADGNGSGKFQKMWNSLRSTKMRLYTIGFGDVGARMDSYTSWDGARGLFNVAWYRSGRYFEPHDAKDLVKVYDQIFEEMKLAPEYAFRIGLEERKAGTLVTEAPAGENKPILFVLDASGSMMAKLENLSKLAIAKTVMKEIVEFLPPESRVGLRAYGHRYRTLDRAKAAKDSELLIRIGKLDKKVFLKVLDRIRARGGTPLAYSLEQARADIRRVKEPRVILITDGMESFRGKPVQAAKGLGTKLTVVGFDISKLTHQKNLRQMAEATGGTYYNASNAKTLVESLKQALRPTFAYDIFDGQGKKVASGKFGDRHSLLEGEYRLTLTTDGKQQNIEFRIHPGRETRVAK